MFEDAGTLVVAIAILVALLGSWLGVALFVTRRRGSKKAGADGEEEFKLPERVVRELERCLELGDYVTRDADTLLALAAAHSPPLRGQVTAAINQLVKTSKSLTGRLNRMGAAASLTRTSLDHRASAPLAPRFEEEPLPGPLPQAYIAQEEIDSATKADKFERMPDSPFEDARRFPRSSFRGSAKATIYPRHPGPGREPVQCTVLTRDLSCGGIGLAYSEQLFPKQIVVLDAVGKLLVGEVRWCRRVDEHFYVAGCRLVKTSG